MVAKLSAIAAFQVNHVLPYLLSMLVKFLKVVSFVGVISNKFMLICIDMY